MKPDERLPYGVVGLLCLMPALFFWVVNGLQVDLPLRPSALIFGGAAEFELYCCAILFPLVAVALGLLALRRSQRRAVGRVIVLVGLLQLAAGVFAALA